MLWDHCSSISSFKQGEHDTKNFLGKEKQGSMACSNYPIAVHDMATSYFHTPLTRDLHSEPSCETYLMNCLSVTEKETEELSGKFQILGSY